MSDLPGSFGGAGLWSDQPRPLEEAMPRNPALLLRTSDIKSVTVSNDPGEGAILRFVMDDDPHDLELHLPALAVAKLQALLIEADTEQARLRAPQ